MLARKLSPWRFEVKRFIRITQWRRTVLQLMSQFNMGDKKAFIALAELFNLDLYQRGHVYGGQLKKTTRLEEDWLQEERISFLKFLEQKHDHSTSDLRFRCVFYKLRDKAEQKFRYREYRKTEKEILIEPEIMNRMKIPAKYNLDAAMDSRKARRNLLTLLEWVLTPKEKAVIVHEYWWNRDPKAFREANTMSQQSYSAAKIRAEEKIKASKEIQKFLKQWYL